jgi:hypothetical protein
MKFKLPTIRERLLGFDSMVALPSDNLYRDVVTMCPPCRAEGEERAYSSMLLTNCIQSFSTLT